MNNQPAKLEKLDMADVDQAVDELDELMLDDEAVQLGEHAMADETQPAKLIVARYQDELDKLVVTKGSFNNHLSFVAVHYFERPCSHRNLN